MMKRVKYDQILDRISSIFQELNTIVESIKNDFEEENRQDPGLTMTIVDYHLNIVKKYNRTYQGRKETDWSLEKELKYTRQNISSFHREFDNPFLGSERWYQRIVQLQDQLSELARELDKLITNEQNK
jgi:hypothetical protein